MKWKAKHFKPNVLLIAAILVLSVCVLLQGCQTSPSPEILESSILQPEFNTETGRTLMESESEITAKAESHFVKADDENNIEKAFQWIEKAFDLNVRNIVPETEPGTQDKESMTFCLDESQLLNRVMIQIDNGKAYPDYICYFHHPNTQKVDIAADDSFEFDLNAVDAAREFLRKLYQIDEEPSRIRAYGYQNKVAIQFFYWNGECFDVRMYYEDYEPVGCFYISSGEDPDVWIDLHKAKILYWRQNGS